VTAAPLIHLDTDLGGDPDDVCALAMLLGSDVELTGLTTTIDPRGQRAGYARHVLRVAGRTGVPVAAGAGGTLTSGDVVEPLPQLWPPDVEPLPGALEVAHDLLSTSIERSATVVAVGPLSTLATLEERRPGTLAGARVVVMGGWTEPLAADLPAYGPADDWNVAVDPDAALVVATSGADLTWVPLAVTLRASLRTVHLPRLRAAGRMGTVLAEQSVTYAELRAKADLGRAHPGLPDDLLLSLHDPLACAVALCWAGIPVIQRRLRPMRVEGGMVLHPVEPNERGVDMGVAEAVDGPVFVEAFLAAVETAGRRSETPPH
jgi:inosine-uridine nucleoside N-ribohydrolase